MYSLNLGYCLPTMLTPFVIKLVSETFGECRFPKKWQRGFDWSETKFELLHSTGKL